MQRLMVRLWKDDGGAILSTEWVFMVTLLVIGLTTGLVAVRNSVNAELVSAANAIDGLNQCYSFNGLSVCGASTCGSAAVSLPATPIPFNAVTPPTAIETNVGGPCSDVALPANYSRTQPVGRLPVTPAAASTSREPCTDEASGGIRPAAATRPNPADCTDDERARMRDANVLPSATTRDKKK